MKQKAKHLDIWQHLYYKKMPPSMSRGSFYSFLVSFDNAVKLLEILDKSPFGAFVASLFAEAASKSSERTMDISLGASMAILTLSAVISCMVMCMFPLITSDCVALRCNINISFSPPLRKNDEIDILYCQVLLALPYYCVYLQ